MTTAPAWRGSAFGEPPTLIDPASNMVGTPIATDDWMLLFLMFSAGSSLRIVDVPVGWTEIRAQTQVGTGTLAVGIYAKKRLAGETTYAMTQGASGNQAVYQLTWFNGAPDFVNWILGAFGTRAASGGTNLINLPSVTSLVPNSLAVAWAVERTTTDEAYTNQTFNNGYVHTSGVELSATNPMTRLGYKVLATPSATGVTTHTSLNTHAQNGLGFQFIIPPIPDAVGSWHDTWDLAIQNRATVPAKILVIGDGISEGQGASERTKRWVAKFRDGLRTIYGQAGGPGYRPAYYAVAGPDSPWGDWRDLEPAPSGTQVMAATSANLGYRHLTMSNGSVASYSFEGTSMDIWWIRGGGTFTYSIDSQTPVAVDTSGAATVNSRTTGISLGDNAVHSVLITVTSGTVNLSGFMVYQNDATTGFHLYDASHSDYSPADHIAGSLHTTAWATVAPDLAIVFLGLDDAGGTTAQFKTALQTIVTELKGLSKIPSILLVAAYNPDTSVLATATWQTYIDKMEEIKASDSLSVELLDLSQVMPTATLAGTGFYSTDGVFPNDSGHTEISSLVLSKVIEFAGGLPDGLAVLLWNGTAAVPATAYIVTELGLATPGAIAEESML